MATSDIEQWVPIKSARLLLSPITLDPDVVADTFTTRSFESVYKWSVHPPWKTQDDAIKWIAAKRNFPTNFTYTITLLDDSARPAGCPRHFGVAGLTSGNELGYQLHPTMWGLGLGSEAVTALLAHAYANPGLAHLDEVEAWVSTENAASAHVLRKCGFVRREVGAVDDGDDGRAVAAAVVAGDGGGTAELSAETVAELRKAVVGMEIDTREGQWERAPPGVRKGKINLERWVTTRAAWSETTDVASER